MNRLIAWAVTGLCCAGLLAACDAGPKSSMGFRLPDGDADTGSALFVELGCNSCHTLVDVELPLPEVEGPVSVLLGGPVARVKTYGQLVSAVINPSHKLANRYPEEEVSRDGESLMRVYNDTMTVQQLIDLVAFLQDQYQVTVPQYSYYSYKY